MTKPMVNEKVFREEYRLMPNLASDAGPCRSMNMILMNMTIAGFCVIAGERP
ncbi:MAG: hypothetical protein GKR96_10015 [Gammaproteobacteria bacterium]|nr:hypothetical protein [Gammaproteobacteria bacterium]